MGALIFCFTLITAVLPSEAASWIRDQKLAAMGRSYPIGAQAAYTLGYSTRIWGVGESEIERSGKDSWKYGYVRAAFNGTSSVVINRAGLEFQFFPISIFGISAGYDVGLRWFSPPWADCVAFDCRGRVDRPYVRAQFVAAVSKVAFSMQARLDRLRSFGGNPFFFDEMTLITGNRRGETILTLNPTLLFQLDDRWRVGGISLYTKSDQTQEYSHLYGPIAHVTFTPRQQLVAGFGSIGSSRVQPALGVFGFWSWTIEPSQAITDLKLR